jgi:hypothetical protein
MSSIGDEFRARVLNKNDIQEEMMEVVQEDGIVIRVGILMALAQVPATPLRCLT